MGGCHLRKASTWHAVTAVFLQFFAWGLITAPVISILNRTFGENAMLMNGIIMGVKGFLSFLSAPLIGSLSDIWGRKIFLLITAFFTCVPIPFIKVDPVAYFVLMSVSGIFCVIFSVAFAYVSDVTDEEGRSLGFGLVTAGFAASLIISPALGAAVELYTGSEDAVVILATVVALLDVVFIILMVPESLPSSEKVNLDTLTFKKVDPFSSLRGIWTNKTVLTTSLVSALSYLPETGQATCFFVYLTLVLGFSKMNVAIFICYIGVLSAFCQTVVLSCLIKYIGPKKTIFLGLTAQLIELVWYGLGTQVWGVWLAGIFISFSSITYAALSAYLSLDTDKDKQGAVQGTLMGVRGLCNGLGPAAFGLMFHLFGINIAEHPSDMGDATFTITDQNISDWNLPPPMIINSTLFENEILSDEVSALSLITEEKKDTILSVISNQFPGFPFLIFSSCVIAALVASLFLKDIKKGETEEQKENTGGESQSNLKQQHKEINQA